MRKHIKKQLPLSQPTPVHPKANEMEKISQILDKNVSICEKALQDITTVTKNIGAQGMTAEQIVRAAIIKQMEGYSSSQKYQGSYLKDMEIYIPTMP
jgi:hypothetical protein